MNIDSTPTNAPEPTVETEASADRADAPGSAEIEELLVEEISIDGMCGVY